MIKTRAFIGATVAAALGTASGGALAQSDSQTRTGRETAVDMAEQIIVTARRVEERLLTVPIAVSAIAGKDLDRLQIRTTDDLAVRTPGLQLAPDPQRSNNFTIRGIARTNQGDPGVVVYVAEVPQDIYGSAPLFDLQSVQVLKGPQGTLFGKNSVGGAVLLVPQRPTREFEGYAAARFGNYSAREFTGTVNVPLSDKIAIRVAGRITRRSALVDNVAGPDVDTQHRQAGRLSLLIQPTDSIENYTIGDIYTSSEYMPGVAGILQTVANCPQSFVACIYDGIGKPLSAAVAEQDALGKDAVALPRVGKSTLRVWGVANHTTIDLGGLTIKNILSYRKVRQHIRSDNDGFRYALFESVQPEMHNRQFTEELQLRGRAFSDRLDWVIGGFYLHNRDTTVDSSATFFGEVPSGFGFPTTPVIGDRGLVSKSRALYGQVTYDLSGITQGLKITGGLRHTWDKRRFRGANFDAVRDPSTCRNRIASGPNAGEYLSGTDPLTCIRTLNASFQAFSWNANLEYQLSPDTFVYATTRRGYKSGSFNTIAIGRDLLSYEPETLTDFEMGFKAQGRMGGMRYNLSTAAFAGRYKGVQSLVSRFDDGVFGSFVVNSGNATIKGFEVEASVTPVTGLDIGGYYTVTDSKYGNDTALGPLYAGQPLLNMPKYTAGLNMRVSGDISPTLGRLSYFVNANFRGSTPSTYESSDTAYRNVPSYTKIDTAVEWQNMLNSEFNLRFYVENLLNNRSPQIYNDLRGFLGSASVIYLPPRMYGVEASVRF